MADRILKLLADPQLRQRMGQAGRETVEAKFDLRKNVAQLIDSYGIVRSPTVREGHLNTGQPALACGQASDTENPAYSGIQGSFTV